MVFAKTLVLRTTALGLGMVAAFAILPIVVRRLGNMYMVIRQQLVAELLITLVLVGFLLLIAMPMEWTTYALERIRLHPIVPIAQVPCHHIPIGYVNSVKLRA